MPEEVQRMSPLPLEKDSARNRRTAFLMVVLSVVIICVIALLLRQGSDLQHNAGLATAPDSPTLMQNGKNALTDQEYAFARVLVRGEIRRNDAVVTSSNVTVGYGRYESLWRTRDVVTNATVKVSYETVFESNIIGHPCMPGRLLNIKLIGDFPDIAVAPMAWLGEVKPQDLSVHAITLTANVKAGSTCQRGVQVGQVKPDPGDISLPLR